MIRREVFEAIGLFDEAYFMYYEEVDFILRAEERRLYLLVCPLGDDYPPDRPELGSERPKRRPEALTFLLVQGTPALFLDAPRRDQDAPRGSRLDRRFRDQRVSVRRPASALD